MLLKLIKEYKDFKIYQKRKKEKNKERRRTHTKSNGKKQTIEYLNKKQGHQCLFCGKEKDLIIDHIIPVTLFKSRDGDILENKRYLCKECENKNTRSQQLILQDLSLRKLKLYVEPKI